MRPLLFFLRLYFCFVSLFLLVSVFVRMKSFRKKKKINKNKINRFEMVLMASFTHSALLIKKFS